MSFDQQHETGRTSGVDNLATGVISPAAVRKLFSRRAVTYALAVWGNSALSSNLTGPCPLDEAHLRTATVQGITHRANHAVNVVIEAC
jgi:hypothetical protein